MQSLTRIVTLDENNINLDIAIKNKSNWSWLEKQINVHFKKVFPLSCKGDPIISFFAGESV